MTQNFSISGMASATLAGAQRVIVPSLGWAGLFIVAMGALFAGAIALPNDFVGSAGFLALVAFALFSHSVFSAAMYHALLPHSSGLIRSAWKLLLAWMLMVVVAAIGGTIIVLFFSLIGSSLGVVSGEAGQDITDMTAEMRAGGTFYPLFALFLLALFGVFWFTVRMMLFAAATSARGAVHVFRTWAWTKGHFLPLAFGMIGFIVIPLIAFGFVSGRVAGLLPADLDPALLAGLSTALATTILTPTAWLGHAFAAHAYQTLAPEVDASS